jgi:ParB-like chromosome segregation protein Spo0J
MAKTKQKQTPETVGPERISAALAPLAVPLGELILDPQNAREHPEENLDQIKLSLVTYGQTKPVVIRQGTKVVIAGNGLVMAARALGWLKVAAAPVELDDKQAKA